MIASQIKPGCCYWYRLADLPKRRVLVDWVCPVDVPDLFCCWDLDSGDVIVLTAADFIQPCEDEVEWSDLVRVGPEHQTAGVSILQVEAGE